MKLELILPFVRSARDVLQSVLGGDPHKGELGLQRSKTTSNQINILCDVSGRANGELIYGMSLATGDRIASAMLGHRILTFDHLATSAIMELANMISGNGLRSLYESGIECNISPPTVVRGAQKKVDHLAIPAIVVPILTIHGDVYLTIGLKAA